MTARQRYRVVTRKDGSAIMFDKDWVIMPKYTIGGWTKEQVVAARVEARSGIEVRPSDTELIRMPRGVERPGVGVPESLRTKKPPESRILPAYVEKPPTIPIIGHKRDD